MKSLEMTSTRLEAFSDAVIAIIITIMVLELKVPHDPSPTALLKLLPVLLSYGLSFMMVAVYWMNHHHLFHLAKRVDSKILWSNNLLLFCLSLIPFFTAYMNEHERNPFSVAMYSGILLICACAYHLLGATIRSQFKKDNLKQVDQAATRKNWIAIGLYIAAAMTAFISPPLSLGLNLIVALMYFMPSFGINHAQNK